MGRYQRRVAGVVSLFVLWGMAGCSGTATSTGDDAGTATGTVGALSATGVRGAPTAVEPELAASPLYRAYQEYLSRRARMTSSGATPGINNMDTSDTLQAYAAKCDAATGIHVPAFNCDSGTEVPEGSGIDTLETNTPIGTGASGSRSVSGTVQTVVATGADNSTTTDTLYLSYQTVTTSSLATAEVKVNSLGNTNALAKAGLMIRDGTAANAAYAWLAITPSSGAVFQTRNAAGATSSSTFLTGKSAPIWLRIAKDFTHGFSGFVSTDHVNWTQVGADNSSISFTTSGLIGLAVTSHSASATTAVFDKYSSNKVCDNPNVLNQECDAGSRFQVLVQTADAAAVGHCRKNGKRPVGESKYNDIAVIQYNKTNGALCFYQALGDLNGASVTEPSAGNVSPQFPWIDPPGVQSIRCTGCHDNGGFIRSKYLTQLTTAPNVLPNQGAGFNNYTPARYVGLDFQNDRSWSITTGKLGANDTGAPCTTCHQLSVNNQIAFNLTHSGWPNGTGANFANVATAASQATKNPHSAASPIWMRPVPVTPPAVNYMYYAPAEASATIYQNCALGFWGFNTTTFSRTRDPDFAVGDTTDPRTADCTFTPLGGAWVYPLTDLNIGTTGGTRSESGTTETITAGGAGILGTSDQFFFAYLTAAGDGTAMVKVTSLVNTDPFAKAGLMFRDTTAATSANVLLGITPTSGATLTNRLTDGGVTNSTVVAGKAAPIWLKVVRAGNSFTAWTSPDQTTWTQIGAPVTFASFNATPLLGLAVTSHTNSAMTTAVLDSFSWSPAASTALVDAALGTSTGSRSESGTTETLSSSGGDIYANADQFYYTFRAITGDGAAVTKVLSQVNTDPYAKAGLMARDGASPDAMNAFVGITPSGSAFQDRPTPGATTTVTNVTGKAVPIWLRLERSGTTFKGSTSSDGNTWSQVTNPYTFASFNPTALIGLAASSHTTSTTTTATFDSMATVTPPGFKWTPAGANTVIDAAIGAATGSHTSSGTTETLTASGGDIYGNADQLFYSFKTITGDGMAVTKVLSQVNTDPYCKAGLDIRDGSSPDAVNAFVGITPSGATFQDRPTVGAATTVVNQTGKAVPIWVRMVRSGRTFIGWTSPDGATWNQVSDPYTFGTFSPAALVGLGASSHTTSTTTTAVFDSATAGLSPTGFQWIPATTTTLADANIGITGGTHTSSGGTETITAAGTDIFGNADQFFYSFKTLTGDGTIIARVTGLTNTNSYAKAGLMFRDGSAGNAANAMVAITPGQGASFQYRPNPPGSTTTSSFVTGKNVAIWLRMVRAGNTFTGSSSPDGTTWTPVGSITLSGFSAQALVGLAVTSHNASTATTATFTNVALP